MRNEITTTVTIVRPAAYSHCRADQISWDVRALLREAIESGVPFGSEAAREQARARVEQINDLLDLFLPN